MLTMTGKVSLCKQHSAAIYMHCVAVWVSLGKNATKMCLLVSSFPINGAVWKKNLTTNQCQSILKLNKTLGLKFILTKEISVCCSVS
jgi:hypothetical protein